MNGAITSMLAEIGTRVEVAGTAFKRVLTTFEAMLREGTGLKKDQQERLLGMVQEAHAVIKQLQGDFP